MIPLRRRDKIGLILGLMSSALLDAQVDSAIPLAVLGQMITPVGGDVAPSTFSHGKVGQGGYAKRRVPEHKSLQFSDFQSLILETKKGKVQENICKIVTLEDGKIKDDKIPPDKAEYKMEALEKRQETLDRGEVPEATLCEI